MGFISVKEQDISHRGFKTNPFPYKHKSHKFPPQNTMIIIKNSPNYMGRSLTVSIPPQHSEGREETVTKQRISLGNYLIISIQWNIKSCERVTYMYVLMKY